MSQPPLRAMLTLLAALLAAVGIAACGGKSSSTSTSTTHTQTGTGKQPSHAPGY